MAKTKRFYDGIEYSNSAELCERMAAECDTAILAFSTGKDSIAAWLQLRKYFKRIVPYYCYTVYPILDFTEDALCYYEDFFQTRIYRLPHWFFYRFMRNKIFQTPYRNAIIDSIDWARDTDYNEIIIGDLVRGYLDLPDAAYVANGVRMADSPYRRMALKNHGAISHNKKIFYPVYDWVKADLLKEFRASGIKLPADYNAFGRTYDGLDYRFVAPMREQFPDDYDKLRAFYPLCELEIVRRDGYEAIGGNRRRDNR